MPPPHCNQSVSLKDFKDAFSPRKRWFSASELEKIQGTLTSLSEIQLNERLRREALNSYKQQPYLF